MKEAILMVLFFALAATLGAIPAGIIAAIAIAVHNHYKTKTTTTTTDGDNT